ncbi:MAG: hypothetical protein FD145_1578 [Candidatus Saganbacteria bacterium]|uniref:GDT1 family protein n=1 Tax=Candidatus Saganbacteria bacterium TaxID=2575572 RepID=A0A833KZL8_UNCSA|nr:MAG: hypothetical protein FD145_1578 [Candidatus Saganbacteria bacterium]
MTAFLASSLFILLAEMGDKTQLLAIAFAAKYKSSQVLFAIFLATVVSHAFAVVLGGLLTKIIPLEIIFLAASLSFILFGLWTLRGDSLENEAKKESKFGPIATVAIAFFIAEMGDKTQLATISLAIEYQNLLGVLMGTITGMVIADAIGIVAGVALKKYLPEKVMKWISAIIFILFGIAGIVKLF